MRKALQCPLFYKMTCLALATFTHTRTPMLLLELTLNPRARLVTIEELSCLALASFTHTCDGLAVALSSEHGVDRIIFGDDTTYAVRDAAGYTHLAHVEERVHDGGNQMFHGDWLG